MKWLLFKAGISLNKILILVLVLDPTTPRDTQCVLFALLRDFP